MPGAATITAVPDPRVQRTVLQWYRRAGRGLPWRETRDPYAVLVSEIMLQQTQVSRVVPIYEAFIRSFPDPRTLAGAPRADVVMAWRGLGYNRRAVALHRAAQLVVERHGGHVPRDLDALLALPGVGEYTARAVRAFAHGIDDAPVDTNIARVLTRAFAGEPVRGSALQRLADGHVPRGSGRDWSAALMDLGATRCVARSPRCTGCPLVTACAWRLNGGTDPAGPRDRRPVQPFSGSSRQLRGRLLDGLRTGPAPRSRLGDVAGIGDARRAMAVADGLVADGLAEWDGDLLRLPG